MAPVLDIEKESTITNFPANIQNGCRNVMVFIRLSTYWLSTYCEYEVFSVEVLLLSPMQEYGPTYPSDCSKLLAPVLVGEIYFPVVEAHVAALHKNNPTALPFDAEKLVRPDCVPRIEVEVAQLTCAFVEV